MKVSRNESYNKLIPSIGLSLKVSCNRSNHVCNAIWRLTNIISKGCQVHNDSSPLRFVLCLCSCLLAFLTYSILILIVRQ